MTGTNLAVENQEEQTEFDREAIYEKVLESFITSLEEEMEVAQNSKDLGSNNEFDSFLEGASAYGRYVDMESLDSRDPSEYRNAWIEWIEVRLYRAKGLLSDDYLSEFKEYDDEDLEQAITEWAGNCIDDFSDCADTIWIILSHFDCGEYQDYE